MSEESYRFSALRGMTFQSKRDENTSVIQKDPLSRNTLLEFEVYEEPDNLNEKSRLSNNASMTAGDKKFKVLLNVQSHMNQNNPNSFWGTMHGGQEGESVNSSRNQDSE